MGEKNNKGKMTEICRIIAVKIIIIFPKKKKSPKSKNPDLVARQKHLAFSAGWQAGSLSVTEHMFTTGLC